MTRKKVSMQWFVDLQEALVGVEAKSDNNPLQLEEGLSRLRWSLQDACAMGGRVFLIGNGGSAAIASHIAVDWTKFLKVRALTLNDPAMVSMIANDFGWEDVFLRQVVSVGASGDVLVAISSSGKSRNILKAVDICRQKKMTVHTFSGFDRDNPLQHRGRLNFWVPSKNYGHIEAAHLCLLHSLVQT